MHITYLHLKTPKLHSTTEVLAVWLMLHRCYQCHQCLGGCPLSRRSSRNKPWSPCTTHSPRGVPHEWIRAMLPPHSRCSIGVVSILDIDWMVFLCSSHKDAQFQMVPESRYDSYQCSSRCQECWRSGEASFITLDWRWAYAHRSLLQNRKLSICASSLYMSKWTASVPNDSLPSKSQFILKSIMMPQCDTSCSY